VIHLHFRVSSNQTVTVGPAPWFRVAGNFIRQGPHGAIIGTFRRHVWEIGAENFPIYECNEPHRIRFEDSRGDAGPVLGPFSKLRVDDGTMTADDKKIVAKFIDPSQHWLVYETETYWPVMAIESAAESI
jgi:hypothetical protein